MADSPRSPQGLTPLEAAHAHAYDRPQPIKRFSRTSTLSSLGDETDTLFDSEKAFEEQHQPRNHRPRSHRGSWFARVWTAIVVLCSVYSTFFSGLWFVLAVTSFQYNVDHRGTLSHANVSTLIAAGAKTIELSFEIVSVAVVGQELTRRLTTKSGNGINLAQMQLKAFLAQPGSMITNWQALFHVAPSVLGVICLFIGATSMLYTTASDSLVSPNAQMTSMGVQVIPATVRSGFSNSSYIQSTCPKQVTMDQDPNAMSACDNVQQTGFVFRNLMTYLQTFDDAARNNKNDLSLVRNRPSPVALFQDVSTVHGQWLANNGTSSEQVVFQQNGRTVNNVTIILPHTGVVASAKAYGDTLAQQDKNGAGELKLKASVPSPAINVQCASFAADDPTLSAIVVTQWSKAQNDSVTPNMTYVLNSTDAYVRVGWYNGSEFDDLWKFTPSQRPPVFPNIPGANNTRISWSQATNGTVYLLGRAPGDEIYMCSMRAMLVHGCSTKYHSEMAGGKLSVSCDPNDAMSYTSSNAPANVQHNFVPAANAWSLSLSLGSTSDSDGSLPRMLSQLWPSAGVWNPKKPSLAESLAVLASSLVTSGAVDTPVGDTDEYGLPIGVGAPTGASKAFSTPDNPGADNTPTPLAGPAYNTSFNAAVGISVYSAGSNGGQQSGFFVVLMGAFFFNVVFLLYIIGTLIARRRSAESDLGADAEGAGTWTLRADLADPQALFGLALNSRPDERLADPTLAPLPRKAMSQRWRVAGGKYSVYIHPIGRRKTNIRAALSSAVSDSIRSVSRKNTGGIKKEHIVRHREPTL